MMRKNHTLPFIHILLIFGLFLFFCSCRTINIERPPESYLPAEFHPPYSNLNIPVNIEIKKLETIVNQQLHGLLYADTSFEDNNHDNLMVKAWKTSDIKLSMEGNQLTYSVPLEVWLKKRFVLGAFGFSVSETKETNAEILLNFKTRITINPDWSISTYTTSSGFEWISTPMLTIGSISVPLPLISDLLISANQKEINKGIDKAISSSLDFRKMAQKSWIDIQQPMKLGNDFPVWARITPVEVRVMPLQSSFGIIHETVGLKALCELFYGSEPPALIQKDLPDLKISSRLENDLNLNILVDIPFLHINELARQQLVGYHMKQGKQDITVTDISLFGNKEKLLVALTLKGSLNGTIYLSGKPVFEKETSSLQIQDLDFDLRTKNVLLKSASWIFHQNIIKTLSSKLIYPVGNELKNARNQLQSYLENNGNLEYFRINGHINDVRIEDIRITQEAVKALFSFSGNLNITLEPN